METASVNVGADGRVGSDRIAILPAGAVVILVVADGAGGMGGGARAAELVVGHVEAAARSAEDLPVEAAARSVEDLLVEAAARSVEDLHVEAAARSVERLLSPNYWREVLADADRHLLEDGEAGESTCVVAVVGPRVVCGASVGDSRVGIVGPEGILDLTERQNRKPLLGSGYAVPVAFASERHAGTLVAASDGLWNYAREEKIRDEVCAHEVSAIPDRLVNLVRLRSGALQDDVSIVVAR